jgi:hypothetical protein
MGLLIVESCVLDCDLALRLLRVRKNAAAARTIRTTTTATTMPAIAPPERELFVLDFETMMKSGTEVRNDLLAKYA